MPRFLPLASLILTLAAFTSGLHAHMAGKGDFQITHPWAEPAETGSTAAYPTLSNDGAAPVVIRSVATPVASEVRLYLRKAPVVELVVPAGEVYGPDDLRFELIGLTRPLKKGEHFPVTLTLADGEPIMFHIVVGEDTVMPEMEMGAVPQDG